MEKYRGKYLFKYCNFLLDKDVKDELDKFGSLINNSLVNLSSRDKNILMQKKEEDIKKKDYIFNSVIPKGELRASNCKGFRDILEYNNKSEHTYIYDSPYNSGVYDLKLCKDCSFYNNSLGKCSVLNIEYFEKMYGKTCGINGEYSDKCDMMVSNYLEYRTIAISFSRVLDNFSLLDWCSNGKGLVLQYKVKDNSKLYDIEYIRGFAKNKYPNYMLNPNELFAHSEEVIKTMQMKFCEKNVDFSNEREVRFISEIDLSKIDKSFTYQIVTEKEIGVELDSLIFYKNYTYLSAMGMNQQEKIEYENKIVEKFKIFDKPIIFIQELEGWQFIHIYADEQNKMSITLYFYKNEKEIPKYHKDELCMFENERLVGIECKSKSVCFYFFNEGSKEERTQEIVWKNNLVKL